MSKSTVSLRNDALLSTIMANTRREGECLRWQGSHTPTGYGTMGFKGRSVRVHRLVHELAVGPIPDGLEIDHVAAWGCRHRDCVNPAHLEAVTHHENLMRSQGVPAVNAGKTHCPKGHPLEGDNLIPTKSGWRSCIECRRVNKYTKVPCPECGRVISRQHLRRHARDMHGTVKVVSDE